MRALATLATLLALEAVAVAVATGRVLDRLAGARSDDWAAPTTEERHARRSR